MKQAIVIGATSGIGRALAERLAAAGWRVGAVGRREALLRELEQTAPANISYVTADITRPEASLAALSELVARLGGMDLCVVCSGTGDLNPALDFALEEPAIATNVRGWTAGWLLSLAVERSSARHYRRLCQWILFLVVAVLIGVGILVD